jgi:hypothetical protein
MVVMAPKKSNMSFEQLFYHFQTHPDLTELEACEMIGVKVIEKKNGSQYIGVVNKNKFNDYIKQFKDISHNDYSR